MRLIALFVVIGVGCFVSSSCMAGDYHTGPLLVCSDCHTMHYSVSHNYTGGPPEPLGPGGPFPHLLKWEANLLCLTCHDGATFAPDVLGANTGVYVRQAGALTTGTAPYEDYKGHTLRSTMVAPGGAWSNATGLECVDCHTIHGETTGIIYAPGYTNGQWRNMIGSPGTAAAPVPVTYATRNNDPTKDVFERDPSLGQVEIHYSVNNVDFNEPIPTDSAYGQWCKGCHTDFHGRLTDPNILGSSGFIRHPTAGINLSGEMLAQYKSHPNRVKVLMGPGPDDYTPSCMSCHKAHGNENAFGLIYMAGTGVVTEEGDSGTALRDLCWQCHTEGHGDDTHPAFGSSIPLIGQRIR